MLKKILILIGILLILGGFFIVIRSQEDTWIKDSRGVWIKHGNPKETPQKVKDQQDILETASEIYKISQESSLDLSQGPCLGQISEDWVLDIAHNPRQKIDDDPQNQCPDYLSGKVHYFVELDPQGNIIKVK